MYPRLAGMEAKYQPVMSYSLDARESSTSPPPPYIFEEQSKPNRRQHRWFLCCNATLFVFSVLCLVYSMLLHSTADACVSVVQAYCKHRRYEPMPKTSSD